MEHKCRELFEKWFPVIEKEGFSTAFEGTNLSLERVETNTVIFSLTVNESLINGAGNLHGAGGMFLIDNLCWIAHCSLINPKIQKLNVIHSICFFQKLFCTPKMESSFHWSHWTYPPLIIIQQSLIPRSSAT